MPRPVLLMISSMRGGGSERQTLMLLEHLNRERFIPHLYVTERVGQLLSRVPEDVKIHAFEGAPSGGIYFPGRALRRQVRHLRRVIAAESIEVIYDRTFHMTLIAGPAARTFDVPRVSTIVSQPHLALPLVESRFVGLKRRRLARWYRESKAVVAVSRPAAQSAEDYYRLPKDCVQVITNPVDVDATRLAAQVDRPQRDQRLTLVCVGRMTPEKGHRDLLSALARTESRWPSELPPVRLWLIGTGPLETELRQQWNATQRRHEVEFLGSRSSALPAIAAADALVLPSHFEGMPNVVLEAMALETPVIATRAGGTVDLQRGEPTILWAEPQQSESLAEAIIEFTQHRTQAKQRAQAALRMVKQHHDARVAVERIEDLMAETVETGESQRVIIRP